ncbi:M10 family metallopeptidase C-terminal domain-containing protein [Microvirga terrae]|uniref:M10 family metallopeptidase C-terminal domain-containing protein n=1 Tax=Microvirga terrae TaxID=2740529 RepID=A0ABY5RWV4_9HYPH|nr:M10 family metallopeptidase C-terminal domain-containing protein [Microvirga terrae]UVF20682.1 M10 family metallopeptidase C-terminal domain-containing protein [Microvirga terrae]
MSQVPKTASAATGPTTQQTDVTALLCGYQWGGSITYAFPDEMSDYDGEWDDPHVYRLSFERQQAVWHILEGWGPYETASRFGLTPVEGFTRLSITYAGFGQGTLQISGINLEDAPEVENRRVLGYSNFPGNRSGGAGNVALVENKYSYEVEILPGSWSYFVIIHELGHALGLKHPHQEAPRGSFPIMSEEHDRDDFTVMSYKGAGTNPQTFMQYDIAALQMMYGANFEFRSGDTIYRWAANGETFVDGVSQGAMVSRFVLQTIWDGNGNDTYDLRAFEGSTVDLEPGGFTIFEIGSRSRIEKGNISNAFQYGSDPRSLIENVLAGEGNDRISGNATANMLVGNGGNDELRGKGGNDGLKGGAGNDWMDGGSGADMMDGGDGWDVASYQSISASEGGVVVNLETNKNGGAARGDKLYRIEVVQGTNANDSLTAIDRGNGSGVQLYGEGGDDGLTGKGGDALFGGAGNDWLDGGPGGDLLDGGAGWDVLSYQSATGGVVVDLTGNQNGGAAAGDQVSNIEVLQGSNYADTLTSVDRGGGSGAQLYGEGGNDTLTGKAGGDYLFGGAGDDLLDSGFGCDVLSGGAGADTFRFSTGPGAGNVDTIQDFSAAEGDRIVLSRSVFASAGYQYLSGAAFKLGAAATAAEHRIVYNQTTGELFYDADGSGAAAQVKFAVIANHASLSAASFSIL